MTHGYAAAGSFWAASARHGAAATLRLAPGGGHASPSGPAFTVVLLVHVAAVLVAMIALVSATVSALRLLRATAGAGELPQSVRTYFAPGFNWAGRALFVVPVAGAFLIALSSGKDHWGDDWVVVGLVLWAVAAALAETQIWPAERRVQAALSALSASTSPEPDAALVPDDAGVPDAGQVPYAGVPYAGVPDAGVPDAGVPDDAGPAARLMWRWSVSVLALLVVATVVMFARP